MSKLFYLLVCILISTPALAEVAKPADGENTWRRGHQATCDSCTIQKIQFAGRTYFKLSTLSSFVESQLEARLNPQQVESDRARIEDRYRDRGFLSASVNIHIRETKKGATLIFVIDAGARSKLAGIQFLGAEHLDVSKLKAAMLSKESSTFKNLLGQGTYHRPFLSDDGQRLAMAMAEQGFLEGRVTSIEVEAEPMSKAVNLRIRLQPGQQYALGSLTFKGDLPPGFDDENVELRLAPLKNSPVALTPLRLEIERVVEQWKVSGHPFAQMGQEISVEPVPSGIFVQGALSHSKMLPKAHFSVLVRSGPKASFGSLRIHQEGALMFETKPKVLDKYIRFKEGDPYSYEVLKDCKRRLLRTGFFAQAEFQAIPRDGDPSIADMVLTLIERPTWAISLAPAYLQSEGLIGVGLLADRNLLGHGFGVSLSGQLSSKRQLVDFGLQFPDIMGSAFSASFELHRRDWAFPDFRTFVPFGGGLGFSYRLGNTTFISGAWTGESVSIRNYDSAVHPDFDAIDELPDTIRPQGVFRSQVRTSVQYDKRDSVLLPRKGYLLAGHLKYAGVGVGSQTNGLQVESNARFYFSPLTWLTLKSSTRIGWVFGLGKDISITERFFLGGFGNLRGYGPRSISGRTRTRGGYSLRSGGEREFLQNLEAEVPIVPSGILRGYVFVDFGNTWAAHDDLFTLDGGSLSRDVSLLPLGMFWSTGVGVLLNVAAAPLRLQLAFPMTKRPYDRNVDFFIGLGSAF